MSRRIKPPVAPIERLQAPIFAALGDRTRLVLVTKLATGHAQSIAELKQGIKLSRQAVTKHLRVLANAGLVQSAREGREMRFEFVPGPMAEARRYLEAVSQQWADALNRLKAFVESE